MNFSLSEEQQMIVATTRDFVQQELYPHEQEIERTGVLPEGLQIHAGMGLMTELPLERIRRDARIERIWDGTSEVQRHIISRALLRPLGG
jgi:alkylation response protein AidB-like acyl-CoA dehydrogenase